ncbi:phosphate transport system permease protein PstA [Rhizocola hellebori]|uniref:Phosphate transport system permease protein PstA n=1 Tax=Rhizocola hellebori TaxID=1392758 RepID=A0A8J3VMN8_9ACTN|nr:phosphate ABC transporter permease PstA [Rhizocola hellebori]GIH11323.1 phosphate transport system permease protein PstA [Rhizocola hellebori]
MTAVTPNELSARPALDLTRRQLSVRRRAIDLISKVLMCVALLIAVVPLVLVIFYVIQKGAGLISMEFLTGDITSPRRAGGGMGPAVVGTLLITGAASVMSIPLGVLGAVYLNEYGKSNALARFIRMMADVMTGVPSIVMALFIYIAVVLTTKEKSGLAAAIALAALMLPVVLRSSEEMLKLVPDELRQASAALGARRWKTTVSVVLPAAISGITSGIMLAIARAAGETTPIVVCAGVASTISWNLGEMQTALPAQIFLNASSPFTPAVERAWGAALTLMVIVLVFTIIARLIASRFAIKNR